MSSDTDESCRLGAFPLFDARRALFDRLEAELHTADPAPWFNPSDLDVESFARGDPQLYVRQCKLAHLTGLTLTRALIAGDLKAHASDGRDAFDMPQWFWEEAWNSNGTRFATRVNIGPLMPDDWQRWNSERLFTDRSTFHAWLAAIDVQSLVHWELLPTPNDDAIKPAPITFRRLPDSPFVTLSEALSWAAFSIALDRLRLSIAMEQRALPDGGRRLADAVERLTEAGAAGQIDFFGKPIVARGQDARSVEMAPIEAVKLLSFRRFDVTDDALAFGKGLMWLDGHEPLSGIFETGRRDEYRSVIVRRSQVLAHFPEPQSLADVLAQPLPVALPDVGPVMGMEAALCLLAHGRRSADLQVWQTPTGDRQIRDHEGRDLRSDPDGAKARLNRWQEANELVVTALREGALTAFIAPADRPPLSISRIYWNSVNPFHADISYAGVTAGDAARGCPILLGEAAFERWRLAQAINTSGADHAPRMTGRPNRRNEAIALHKRRLAANIALSNNSAEARAIHDELAALHNGDADWRYDPGSIERALREWRKNEGG